MTSKEFITELLKVANMKTYYIKGGFGLVLNASGKKRAISSYKWNADRADKINSLDPATFGFDCCGLVKGVLWGFNGNLKKTYGGAVYNQSEDLNEKGLFNICNEISDDLTNIIPGEFLYMPGHCGIYIGNGNVVESTPSWKNGVQITELGQRKWKAHGKLPQIQYEDIPEHKPITSIITPPYYLRQGSTGMYVQQLQHCLNLTGADLEEDARFGTLTKHALMVFQMNNKIEVDGIYGPESQKKLREVLRNDN